MSSVLYRLGHAIVRRAGLVLALWAALLVVMVGLAVGLGGQLQDDLTIPGTESQNGLDALTHRFPEVAGTSAQVLVVAPDGDSIRDHAAEVGQLRQRLGHVDHVILATDPFTQQDAASISHDGRDALLQVQFDLPLDKVDTGTMHAVERAAHALPSSSPLHVYVGGQLFTSKSVQISPTEGIGVLVALLVLVITFGSLLAAGLPILSALLGVGVGMCGVLAIAAFGSVNSSTPTLALMIGLAVGIDYALFIVSRHRGQLARGMDPAESIAQSVATAGSAVIFAGATVIIALCGLVVANIPFLAVMGYAAAATVAVAVAVAVTAVPAFLGLAGERLRPKEGSRAARNAVVKPEETHTLGARWVRLVTRVPALTAVLAVGVLLVMALPARDLALGLPDNGAAETGSTQRVTYDRISHDYGPGYNTPLLVTVDIVRTTDPIGVMNKLGADLGKLPGVDTVALTTPNRSADLGIVQIVPDQAQTAPETAALVRTIRGERATLEHRYDITQLRVTGQTAVAIDVSDQLFGALLPFGLVVVGLSLVLLTIVFRSLAVPLKATLGYLLSVGASFGAVTAVFEWGWLADQLNVPKVGPVIAFLPIMLMGVLFGLAMDYEVFLVSRMREEYVHSGDPRRAVLTGFTGSARVVTAAAVIMISVFAAFVPRGDSTVQPIALGLAVGVFVDAFLVRMTLVPAVLALLGDRAWQLPGWLDRRLPSLDVEGAGIAKHVEHDQWTQTHGRAVVRAEGLTLEDQGERLFEGIDLVLQSGELCVVRAADPVRRRALLATLTGRLQQTDGRLVVLDRVLPAEMGAVRRRVALHARFPGLAELDQLGEDVRRGRRPLIVVDEIDGAYVDDEQVADRWEALRTLADHGATVVAGCRGATPPGAGTIELTEPRTDPRTDAAPDPAPATASTEETV